MKNWYDFVNTADVVDGHWDVKADGRTVASGAFPALDLAPREEKTFTLALPAITPEPGVEYWLNVSFTLKADTLWAKKGFEVAWDQFALPWKQTLRQHPPHQPAICASWMMRAWRGSAVLTGRSASTR